MRVNYRQAVEAEIPETVEIFLESVVEMYARNGIKAPPPERSMVLMNYRHVWRTGIFYVAEVEGALAAICHAVVRGRLWFLSGFWARPGLQRQGVGGRLLSIVTQEGARRGAQVFFTWSSVDLTAMATYMKMGMLPGYQILTFAGRPADAQAGAQAALEVAPLSLSFAAQVDERVRGTAREEDHRFWLGEAGYRGRQVERDGRALGYFYSNRGTIGPAAWAEAEAAPALLETALVEASRESADVRLMIPGVNHAAIRFALSRGLKLAAFTHLLTTAPFGRMEQYMPSGPSLF